jgi:hypothetical protein
MKGHLFKHVLEYPAIMILFLFDCCFKVEMYWVYVICSKYADKFPGTTVTTINNDA